MSSTAATAFGFVGEDESRLGKAASSISWVFIAGFWDMKYYIGDVESNSMVSL